MKLAFYHGKGSFFSKLIRLWTFGSFSHVEIVFSDGLAFSSHEADGGTRFKQIDFTAPGWELVDVPVSQQDEARIRAWCRNEDGCAYDWRGITFSFLPIPIGWQHSERWFCSEICAAAVQLAGYLSGYTPAALSPNGLYKALCKELSKNA